MALEGLRHPGVRRGRVVGAGEVGRLGGRAWPWGRTVRLVPLNREHGEEACISDVQRVYIYICMCITIQRMYVYRYVWYTLYTCIPHSKAHPGPLCKCEETCLETGFMVQEL